MQTGVMFQNAADFRAFREFVATNFPENVARVTERSTEGTAIVALLTVPESPALFDELKGAAFAMFRGTIL